MSDSSVPYDDELTVDGTTYSVDALADQALAKLALDDGPVDFDELHDPVLQLTKLVTENGEAMAELTKTGARIEDAHPLITGMIVQAYLEAILRAIAGEAAVIEVGVDVHEKIGTFLATTKQQAAAARLTSGVTGPASAWPQQARR